MALSLWERGFRPWSAGRRRGESRSRAGFDFLPLLGGRWKLHPLADWTDRDVGDYLRKHGLPYHPLWHRGYVSNGDVHTTRQWEPGMREEETRFFVLWRESGLHFDEIGSTAFRERACQYGLSAVVAM